MKRLLSTIIAVSRLAMPGRSGRDLRSPTPIRPAKSRNKSNVPVGLYVGKMVKIGKIPLNIKAIVEYSVVSQDTWGKRAASRFEITPVIRSLITEPIFGK